MTEFVNATTYADVHTTSIFKNAFERRKNITPPRAQTLLLSRRATESPATDEGESLCYAPLGSRGQRPKELFKINNMEFSPGEFTPDAAGRDSGG